MVTCIRPENLTISENVFGLPASIVGTGGFGFPDWMQPKEESYLGLIKPQIKGYDETYYSDTPILNFAGLHDYFQHKISLVEEAIDSDSRLYPVGDKSFGHFVPGISEVQMPAFSFLRQDKTLPTFKEELIELNEE